MAKILDTNLVLRYLLDDPGASKIEKLLKKKEKLLFPDMVFAEIVWTLDSYYSWDRSKIADSLLAFIKLSSIKCNEVLLISSLDIFSKYKRFSFVDSYLVALMKEVGVDSIYSFDRGFDKIHGIKREEPT